jgi:hypothetical protein
MRRGAALLLAGLAASAPAAAVPPPPGPAVAADLAAGGCTLCHTHPALPPAPRTEGCASCHAWVRAVAADPARRAKAAAAFPHWDRYEASVASYLAVPDLAVAGDRLESAWIANWLADPHDLRPGLPEGMPRVALPGDARARIAAWLTQGRPAVPGTPPPTRAGAEAGAVLARVRGCLGCHPAGGLSPGNPASGAPDLAFTRSRMDPDRAVAWIQDPRAVSPGATMPALGLTPGEATAIRDWLWAGIPAAPPAPALGPLPAPAAEPVLWATVEERVFGRICVHCHMSPARNEGRAGPGNAGGFGWAPTGIALQTPAEVAAVAARIPGALARRRQEAPRDHVPPGHAPVALSRPARPGMPLGLPPLSDADHALVLGWIAQGCRETAGGPALCPAVKADDF